MAAGTVAGFFGGVRCLAAGVGLIVRRPRLFWLGALPPLIMSVLLAAVLVALVIWLPEITAGLTPFADGWSSGAATAVRVVAGVAVLGGTLVVLVVSFTTVTLAVGSPIYDKISESVDAELGGGGQVAEESLVSGAGRAVRQSLALIGISALVTPVLFVAGFVPIAGQFVVPVVSACFGGWMICLELVGSTFDRRGLVRLADRRAAMRRRRARALGFGVPTFLLLAIPFVGVVVFPVATAGATVLARDLLEQRVPR